jgi:hypothetical protein
LSPIPWCLVVEELIARLNGDGVYTQGYVDDICLLVVGKFLNTVSGLIQWSLHAVETWCDELGLSVSPDKTGLIAFTTRRKLPRFFKTRFFGMVKYLGVILGAQLTWREHIDTKVRKARNFLWACKRACSVRWGLRPMVVHWLYVSIVRLSITFASLVWWPGCETVSAKQQLSKVQWFACLGIMGAMCTTPTNAVEALVCLSPLESVVQAEARATAHRCGH